MVVRQANVVSPNHQQKQEIIVAAAQTALVEHGLAGCTVRSVAAAGALTKSSIHYYFADFDVLIDRAMAAHLNDFVALLRKAASRSDEKNAKFFAVVKAYFNYFDKHPNAAFLWFEYWNAAQRANNPQAIDVMHRSITALITELLVDFDIDDPRARARTIFSYLLGAVVQQRVRVRSFSVIRAEIELLCRPDREA